MNNPEALNNDTLEETLETELTFEQQMLGLMADFGIPEECLIDFTEVCFRETSHSIDLYFQKDYSSLRDFSSPEYQEAIREANKPILRVRSEMEATQKGRQYILDHQLPEDTIPIVPLLSPEDDIHPILYEPITNNPELEEKRAELLNQIFNLFSHKYSEKGMKARLEREWLRNSNHEGLRRANVFRSWLNLPPFIETQLTPRDRIVESGIADRILATLKTDKGKLEPEITFGVEDCDFRVEVRTDPRTREKQTFVIIDKPNLNPENRKIIPRVTIRFRVKEGQGFGNADEEPLSNEQIRVVQELADRANQQSS